MTAIILSWKTKGKSAEVGKDPENHRRSDIFLKMTVCCIDLDIVDFPYLLSGHENGLIRRKKSVETQSPERTHTAGCTQPSSPSQ